MLLFALFVLLLYIADARRFVMSLLLLFIDMRLPPPALLPPGEPMVCAEGDSGGSGTVILRRSNKSVKARHNEQPNLGINYEINMFKGQIINNIICRIHFKTACISKSTSNIECNIRKNK